MANVNIKRAKCALFTLMVCFMLSACDFNVNDGPGPQMSSSVKESQKHSTFIGAYKVNGDAINGIRIETIFAEKKFWREKGFLLKKEINCCESQLVIVSATQPFSTQTSGYDTDWKILGFVNPSPSASIIYRDYKGVLLPDSIPITVVAIKGKDSSKVIQKLILYKIHN